MKKSFLIMSLSFVVLVLTLGSVLVQQVWAEPVSMYERKLRFDNDVVSQIYRDLEQLVDKKYYKILASSEFERQKQWQTQQVFDDSSPRNLVRKENTNLPGFRDLKGTTSRIKNRKTAVTYEEIDNLKSLTILLYLDPSMPKESAKLIESYLEKNWVDPWPEIVHLIKKTVNLPQAKVSKPETFTNTLLKQDKWLLLAGLLVLFIIAVILRRGKSQTDFNINTQQSTPETNQENLIKEEERLNVLKDRFIDEVTNHPLISRGYLQSLEDDKSQLLLSYFNNTYLKAFMARWTNAKLEEIDADEELKAAPMAQFVSELCEYKKLRQKQIDLPLGYLVDLTSEELSEILSKQSLEILGVVIRYLPRRNINVILSSLSKEKQTTLLNELQTDKVVDENLVKSIDKKLRAQYQKITGKLLLSTWPENRLTEMLLDDSEYGHIIAEEMIAKNPQLRQGLQKYTIGFGDLLLQDKKVIQRILDEVNNEQILHAIQDMDEEFKFQLYRAVSSERGKVLKGLSKSIGQRASKDEIQEAKTEIVKKIRQVLYSKSQD